MKKLVVTLVVFLMWVPVVSAENLYNEKSFRALTSDHRAREVGDSITILIFENSSAMASADTSTEKRGGVGLEFKNSKRTESANLDLSDEFSGKGRIQRSGKLVAQLTVTVDKVTSNGELLVKGEQWIEVNDEKQHIMLEGRVRPQDIGEDNTVISTRLANANITYLGEGILGEKQKPGVLTRILTWMGLL